MSGSLSARLKWRQAQCSKAVAAHIAPHFEMAKGMLCGKDGFGMGLTGREMIKQERERLAQALRLLDEDHDAAGNLISAHATQTRASTVRRIAECDEILGGGKEDDL
jgi:hypothetical protein